MKFFFFNDTATTEIYPLSLHAALPISRSPIMGPGSRTTCASACSSRTSRPSTRSEEHTSELQSQSNLVCRLLLEKKKDQVLTHLFENSVRNTATESLL